MSKTIFVDGSKISPRMDSSFLQNRTEKLIQELTSPSICDKCVNFRLCAIERKACEEFTDFVEAIPGMVLSEHTQKVQTELTKDGSTRVPTRDIYKQHFVH